MSENSDMLPTPSPSTTPTTGEFLSSNLTVETVLLLILVCVIMYTLGILTLHLVRSAQKRRRSEKRMKEYDRHKT